MGARDGGGIELSTALAEGEEEKLCGNEGSEDTG